MSLSATEAIQEAFGRRELPYSFVGGWPYALRLDLADFVEGKAPRFLQAMERAIIVAEALFAGSQELAAFVHYDCGKRRTRNDNQRLEDIEALGFPYSFGQADRVETGYPGDIGGDPESLYRCWHMAEFPPALGDPSPALAVAGA